MRENEGLTPRTQNSYKGQTTPVFKRASHLNRHLVEDGTQAAIFYMERCSPLTVTVEVQVDTIPGQDLIHQKSYRLHGQAIAASFRVTAHTCPSALSSAPRLPEELQTHVAKKISTGMSVTSLCVVAKCPQQGNEHTLLADNRMRVH